MNTTTATTNTGLLVTTEVSIRRKPGLVGLPGDDPTNYNIKLGSSLKGDGPLRGLNREEEKKYLPSIINVYPEDHTHWLTATSDYWSNIAVPIPSDEETENRDLRGKLLRFVVEFTNKGIVEQYNESSLEDKATIIEKYGKVVEGVPNYVLFRYCLVYGRVANRFSDIGKSAKIWFYLYSKDQERKAKYNVFKERAKANRAFLDIMDDEKIVNSLLRMFGTNPETLNTLEDKHLKLDEYIKDKPTTFLDFIKDKDLSIKSSIKRAVELGIIYNPQHTDSYYYGAEHEVLLGNTLLDTVLFMKSTDEKKVRIKESIIAQIKNM